MSADMQIGGLKTCSEQMWLLNVAWKQGRDTTWQNGVGNSKRGK